MLRLRLLSYLLIALALAGVLLCVYATRGANDTGWTLAGQIIAGAASTFLVLFAGLFYFWADRLWRTQRRIRGFIARNASTHADDPGAVVARELAEQLSATLQARHAIVRVEPGAPRESFIASLTAQLAEHGRIAVTVSSPDSGLALKREAAEAFAVVADRAGERPRDIARLWEWLMMRGSCAVIVSALDADLEIDRPQTAKSVIERIARLADVPVATVILVRDGVDAVSDVTVVSAAVPSGSMGADSRLVRSPNVRLATMTAGRAMHLRNASRFTLHDLGGGSDLPAAALGLAELKDAGVIREHTGSDFEFTSLQSLAQARALGAGLEPESGWSDLLALASRRVILASFELAVRDAIGDGLLGNLDEVRVTEVARIAALDHDHLTDPVVLGSILRGTAAGGARINSSELVELLSTPARVGRFAGSLPLHSASQRDQLDLLESLDLTASLELAEWCWRALRDGAQEGRRLSYPVRRALVTKLCVQPDRTARILIEDPIVGAAALAQRADVSGVRGEPSWEFVGAACHLAWLLPLVYAGQPQDAGVENQLRELGRLSLATHESLPDGSSFEFLQAWAEGVYFALLRVEDPAAQATLRAQLVPELAMPSPWGCQLSAVMGLPSTEVAQSDAVLHRRGSRVHADGGSQLEPVHPLVIAAAAQVTGARHHDIAAPDGSRLDGRDWARWNDEFEELRTGALNLTPDSRWILAAKAVLFSACEARSRLAKEPGADDPGAQTATREVMLGTQWMPEWISAAGAKSSGSRPGSAAPRHSVTAEQIMREQNRRVTPTLARSVLARPAPMPRWWEFSRADERRFWQAVREILERIGEQSPIARDADLDHGSSGGNSSSGWSSASSPSPAASTASSAHS